MQTLMNEGWMLICVTTGLFLFIGLILRIQSRQFCTLDVVVRKFSIMDLEFPASPREITNIVNGIYELPPARSEKTLRFLKAHLYTDFLFMPVAYGSIFIACMKTAEKMLTIGHNLFIVLAWLQIVAWLLDIIENIYLLNKLKPTVVPSSKSAHKAYQLLQVCKWGIALTGAICSLSALLYFWLVGNYKTESLTYLAILVAEVIIVFVAAKLTSAKKEDLECE